MSILSFLDFLYENSNNLVKCEYIGQTDFMIWATIVALIYTSLPSRIKKNLRVCSEQPILASGAVCIIK